MKSCYYYFAISPFKKQYIDSEGKKPLIKIDVKIKNKDCEIAFYGSQKRAKIDFVRIVIPDCKNDELTEKDLEIIQSLKEHAISVLRLTYDPMLNYDCEFWSFQDPKKKGHRLKLQITPQKNPDYRIPVEKIQQVFCGSFKDREKYRLLADSVNRAIPPQYRFLALHKVLELNFKKGGKLDTKSLEEFLKQFKVTKKKIFSLRDKCVHITDKKGEKGVTQLTRKEMKEVEEFLPLFLQIADKLFGLKKEN